MSTLADILRSGLVPLCFISTWIFLTLLVWSLWETTRVSASYAARMRQVPCANCQFFTGEYRLKCTIHPSIALSEAAIGCPDYQDAIALKRGAAVPESRDSEKPDHVCLL
jgi:hypothetical protein